MADPVEKKGLALLAEHQGTLWGLTALAAVIGMVVLPEIGGGVGKAFALLTKNLAEGANAVQSAKLALMGVAVTLLIIATAVVGLIKWRNKPPAPPAP